MENLLKCNGRRFRANIEGVKCDGKIRVEDGLVYLCQNEKNGNSCNNKFGYKYSWSLPSVYVSGLELYPPTAAEIEAYKDWQIGDKVSRPDVDVPDVMEVIFRAGKMVACEDRNEDAYVYTCNGLYNEGWRLVADPEPEDDTVELTLDQIADKFGIEPGKLRIKKKIDKIP